MKAPLVSIIIPVYNTAQYLIRCVDSALAQTHKNIEVIAIDDGSTDGCYDLLTKHFGKHPCMTILSQSNRGVSSARNYGLNVAKGEFVCFLDSDDWLEPDALEHLLSIGGSADEIVACDRSFAMDNHGELLIQRQRPPAPPERVDAKTALLSLINRSYNLQSACYKLYPRCIVEKNPQLRFHEDVSHGEDGLFVLEVLQRAQHFVFSSEPKWVIFSRPDSATSQYSSKMMTAFVAVDRMLETARDEQWKSMLKLYYSQRVMQVLREYSVAPSPPKDDLKILRSKLSKYQTEYVFGATTLRQKGAFLMWRYGNIRLSKVLSGIKRR